MPRLDTRDDPLPQIQRVAMTHDPPPTPVNHASAPKGIRLDPQIGRAALDVQLPGAAKVGDLDIM